MSKLRVFQYSGYAGFWRRFGSNLLDLFVVLFILLLVDVLVGLLLAFFHPVIPPFPGKFSLFLKSFLASLPFKRMFSFFISRIEFFLWIIAFVFLEVILIPWLYSSIMHSSSRQATFGMEMVRDKITDLNGNRISFWRASARYWLKFIFGLVFVIGIMDNILIVITGRKQAFHDILTGCLIWREKV